MREADVNRELDAASLAFEDVADDSEETDDFRIGSSVLLKDRWLLLEICKRTTGGGSTGPFGSTGMQEGRRTMSGDVHLR